MPIASETEGLSDRNVRCVEDFTSDSRRSHVASIKRSTPHK